MAESGDHVPNGSKSAEDADADEDPELQRIKAAEDELAQRVSAEVSSELNSHIAKLEQELKLAFDERMSAIQQQYSSQAAEDISTRQTDILRTNKVLRDVSRALGSDWRPVLESLMAQLPDDVREGMLKKVEAERPVLQAYKALMSWKEACGPDFDIRLILDALHNNGLIELEQMTLNILDSSENESLITLAGFGSKTRSAAGNVTGVGQASSVAGLRTTQGTAAAAAGGTSAISNPADLLDDRHLLQLAKRIPTDWDQLAKHLSVAEDDVSELLSSEGRTYQGAFRMLWDWREASSDLRRSLDSLIAGLRQLGHSDVVDAILR